ADATEICVEIKGGGRQLIRITDNGYGMNRDDAVLCFERHATSKISEIDDIHSLVTMGFRGEAIPSIGSISKLTLLTCTENEEEGTLVIVDGGRIVNCSPAARSPGTTIEVKSLFFNVPVRKKFQKSPTYDASEILKVVSIQALAHPSIKFQLISNQKNLLLVNTSQGSTLQELAGGRISSVLGSDFFAGTCPVEREHNQFKVTGFIGLPAYTRHNRTGQYLFINQRAVFSPLISYAVREAYGTTLATNRHPVFVLYATLPGSLVDVNVHPQKREVRLRQGQALREMVLYSVEDALQKAGIHSTVASYAFSEPPSFTIDSPVEAPPPPPPPPSEPEPVIDWTSPPSPPTPTKKAEEPPHVEVSVPLFETEETPRPSRVVATIPGFLLLSTECDSWQLVDQRAAHSRVLYEKLVEQSENSSKLEVQQLLIPYTLEMTPIEAAVLNENISVLQQLGVNIQDFGNNSFIIHALPQMWVEANIQQLITEIVNDLREYQSDGAAKQEKEKRIARAAGRAAVPQKKKLTIEEGQSLVNQLMKCKFSHQCPYGKPTIVEMTHKDISKQFQK
ncbi:MAG: hypothetical protein K940chlam7_00427, partial [Chlamydiae bacterium]|nr:hypothetical protein [Chlamydiota bacterium]